MIWEGEIRKARNRMEIEHFRIESEIKKELKQMRNKSAFIRRAVKEKLRELNC